jgi:cyclase
MRKDGMRNGYDLDHCRAVVETTTVPVIASGGAGSREHFRDAFIQADVSGALAATVFHDRLILIPELKEYLAACEIEMRR